MPWTVCPTVGYLAPPAPAEVPGHGASLSSWITPQNWSHPLGSLESGCHLIPLEASCRVGGSGGGVGSRLQGGVSFVSVELTHMKGSPSCSRWRSRPPTPPPAAFLN